MADKEKRLAAAKKKLKVFKDKQQNRGNAHENEAIEQQKNGVHEAEPDHPIFSHPEPFKQPDESEQVSYPRTSTSSSSVAPSHFTPPEPLATHSRNNSSSVSLLPELQHNTHSQPEVFSPGPQPPPNLQVQEHSIPAIAGNPVVSAHIPVALNPLENYHYQPPQPQNAAPIANGVTDKLKDASLNGHSHNQPSHYETVTDGKSGEQEHETQVHSSAEVPLTDMEVQLNHIDSFIQPNERRRGPILNPDSYFSNEASDPAHGFSNARTLPFHTRPPSMSPRHPYGRPQSPDVYELELSQLRQDNQHLQRRESELVGTVQTLERRLQDLRRDAEESRQELRTQLGPLKQKATIVAEENQELKRRIEEMTLQLTTVLEEKEEITRKFQGLEAALITVTSTKMNLAEELDLEKEELRALKPDLIKKHAEVHALTINNQTMASQIEAMEKQMQAAVDETRRSRLHEETELRNSKARISQLESEIARLKSGGSVDAQESHSCSGTDHHHHHEEATTTGHNRAGSPTSSNSCSHDHDDHDHSHAHVEQGTECVEGSAAGYDSDHDHYHGTSGHSHDHGHNHVGESGHGHSHSHGDNHEHGQESVYTQFDANQPTPMEKKLARLEWENASFRQELDRLAALLKVNTVDSHTFEACKAENERMKAEMKHLEHLVVQLQGENDTIGDYVALYQGQRLALKERAREKEIEMANLNMEREKLRLKMEELNHLLMNSKDGEKPVEKINELIAEISTNFHPCGLCSGRLMNV